MPGLSFAYHNYNAVNRLEKFTRCLKETEYLETFTTENLLKTDQTFLGFTKSFSEYPLASFENERYQVWMEGKVYNLKAQQVFDNILSLCDSVFSNSFSPLSNWLTNTDGEFVIFARDKRNNNWAICHDMLGRLPLYFFKRAGTLTLSRDIRFVRTYADISDLDRTGLGQFMMFGHLIGNRTFYQHTQKVLPGTLFFINHTAGTITVKQLGNFDYSHKKNRACSAQENAEQLTDLFITACKNRVNFSSQSVLQLSGGYDSRSLAAGLKKAGADFSAFSWVRKDKKNELDYIVAEQISELLQIPWTMRHLNNCSNEDIRISFLLKSGLDLLGFVYPIHNVRYLQQTYGSSITVFNGLGGDQFIQNVRPKEPLYTIKSLQKYILYGYPLWKPDNIEKMMGVSQTELINCINEAILNYPEKSLKDKFVHWRIHEYEFSRFFESNDRALGFYWSGTPHSSYPVFDYAMNCPDSQKAGRYLYTLMLKNLSPELIKIPYARNGADALETIEHYVNASFQRKERRKQWIYNARKTPNPVRFIYKKVKKGIVKPVQKKPCNSYTPAVLECLRRQTQIPEITQYFSNNQLDQIIQNPTFWGENKLCHLFTILTVIEDFHGLPLTVEQYNTQDWYADRVMHK